MNGDAGRGVVASVLASIVDAWRGTVDTYLAERNLRIHLAAAYGALWGARVLALPGPSVALVLLAAAFVIAMELVNTAVEQVVDLGSPGYDERAGRAKRIAAAAVLVAAATAVGVGLALFGPDLPRWGEVVAAFYAARPGEAAVAAGGFAALVVGVFLPRRRRR